MNLEIKPFKIKVFARIKALLMDDKECGMMEEILYSHLAGVNPERVFPCALKNRF